MSERAKSLANRMAQQGSETQEFFSAIKDDNWSKQVYADGDAWNILNILTHITEAESSVLRLIRGVVNGGEGAPEDFDLDIYNERQVRAAGEVVPNDLINQFVKSRKKFVDEIDALSDKDLDQRGNHPFFGDADVAEMIKGKYLDVKIHLRDIWRILSE